MMSIVMQTILLLTFTKVRINRETSQQNGNFILSTHQSERHSNGKMQTMAISEIGQIVET